MDRVVRWSARVQTERRLLSSCEEVVTRIMVEQAGVYATAADIPFALLDGEPIRSFARLWATGLFNPSRAFADLKSKPAPQWGFAAVVLRFGFTTLTQTVPLYVRGRVPLARSYLPFLPTERYYAAQRFFLPVFGVGTWLAMSGLAHGALRRMGQTPRFDQVLNIVGMGMLIPLPPLSIWDWTMIALDRFRLPEMAVSHALVELWEAILLAIGFHQVLGLGMVPALGLGLALGGVYVALAMLFVR